MILLHQSPSSSLEYIPLIERWADDFTVIAPDNPGNGMSDPLLIENPSIEDYAASLIEFMDVMEIEQALAYGFHTGACIGMTVAALYPDRFKHVIANGVSLLNEEETRELVSNYSPKLEKHLDGSHLSWLWNRIMLQSRVFPWYSTREEDQIDVPPYTAEKAHRMLIDFLMAGNNYIGPYNAAFTGDYVAKGYLPNSKVTVCFTKRDPTYRYYDQLPAGQECAVFKTVDDCLDNVDQILKSKQEVV